MNTTPATPPAGGQPNLSGTVMFYKQPQPLSAEAHAGLGVKQIEQPFAFLRESHAVPVTVSEFGRAASFYPLIFVGEERTPVAVMGIRQGQNLYVDNNGFVADDHYVPAFVRRYPFVFASDEGSDRLVLCVDRAAPMVSNQPEVPFFENGQPSKFTNDAIEFCKEFERQRQATVEFGRILKDMDLLEQKTVSFQPRDNQGNNTGESQVVAKYWSIDEEKLNALPDAKLVELQRNGMLGACFAQIMSLLNWSRVINRALRAQSNEAVQEPQGGSTGPSLQI